MKLNIVPGDASCLPRGCRQCLACGAFLVVLLAVLATPAAGTNRVGTAPALVTSCRGIYHTVRPGQTIYSIARMYGSTAYRIKVCNGLRSSTVYVSQTLLVPLYRQDWGG